MSVFCRHNRFTADCPICSKGTVLDQGQHSTRRKSPRTVGAKRPAADKAAAPAFSGPYVAGPARPDEEGALAVVRLERVPGGVRLGEWRGSALAKRAPILAPQDLIDLVVRAGEALQTRDAARLTEALAVQPEPPGGDAGVSRGRSGDFKEELRIERLEDTRLRVARWVLRPGSGWELQDAPPMLPAARYAEALADAARHGLLQAAGATAHSS